MAGKSDYLENKLIDHIFRGTAFIAPTNLYIGLFKLIPSDAGGGTEVSGGSYARVQVACNGTNWANTQASGTGVSSGAGGTTSNSVAITFPVPTGDWGAGGTNGQVGWFGIFDASSAGNLLYWAALTAAKSINTGDAAPSYAAGALTVTED